MRSSLNEGRTLFAFIILYLSPLINTQSQFTLSTKFMTTKTMTSHFKSCNIVYSN